MTPRAFELKYGMLLTDPDVEIDSIAAAHPALSCRDLGRHELAAQLLNQPSCGLHDSPQFRAFV
jgi:hypothetical protein